MPSFQYTAVSAAGQRVAGVLPAASQQAALIELEARRLTPLEIREQGEGQHTGGDAAADSSLRIGPRELATAYKQVGDLLRAGVPLLRALQLISAQRGARRAAPVFRALADDVADGQDLAAAMVRHPRAFRPADVAMVRAGEKGGFLDAVLTRLGAMLEAQADLRAKLIGNLVYPCVLLVVGAMVIGAIFGVFVPQFRPMFAKLEEAGQLPVLTRIVLAAGESIVWIGPLLIITAGMAAAALWQVRRTPRVQRAVLSGFRRAPVVGELAQALPTARLARTLGTLLANGVPLLGALKISRDACGHPLLEEAVENAAAAVGAGESLAAPLGRSGLLADDVVEMISVGEASNTLDDVLLTIADSLEKRVDRLLTLAVRLVEPLLLMVLAGVVGLIAAALIVPITRLSQAVN